MALPAYITVELAMQSLGLDAGTDADGMLTAILEDSVSVVEWYAPTAPDPIKRRAVMILGGDLFDRLIGTGDQPAAIGYFRGSGARAYLAPWHGPGASIVRPSSALIGPPSAEELDGRLGTLERTQFLRWGPRGG